MGFEVSKGSYVTFDKGELAELKPESTRAIEITDFVDLDEIDPIYYERTYWLAPDGDGAKKAYGLLVAAMTERNRVGIGTVVMRNKEYLTAVRPLDTVLAMSTMRFADEVVPRRDVDALPSRASKPDAKAMRMAAQLIDGLTAEWKPDAYHDTYAEDLRRRIKAKDSDQDVVRDEPAAEPSGKVLDLMAALEASLEKGTRPRRRTAGTTKSAAKSKGTKSKARKRPGAQERLNRPATSSRKEPPWSPTTGPPTTPTSTSPTAARSASSCTPPPAIATPKRARWPTGPATTSTRTTRSARWPRPTATGPTATVPERDVATPDDARAAQD